MDSHDSREVHQGIEPVLDLSGLSTLEKLQETTRKIVETTENIPRIQSIFLSMREAVHQQAEELSLKMEEIRERLAVQNEELRRMIEQQAGSLERQASMIRETEKRQEEILNKMNNLEQKILEIENTLRDHEEKIRNLQKIGMQAQELANSVIQLKDTVALLSSPQPSNQPQENTGSPEASQDSQEAEAIEEQEVQEEPGLPPPPEINLDFSVPPERQSQDSSGGARSPEPEKTVSSQEQKDTTGEPQDAATEPEPPTTQPEQEQQEKKIPVNIDPIPKIEPAPLPSIFLENQDTHEESGITQGQEQGLGAVQEDAGPQQNEEPETVPQEQVPEQQEVQGPVDDIEQKIRAAETAIQNGDYQTARRLYLELVKAIEDGLVTDEATYDNIKTLYETLRTVSGVLPQEEIAGQD